MSSQTTRPQGLSSIHISRLLQYYGVPSHSVVYTLIEHTIQENKRLTTSAANLQLSLDAALDIHHKLQDQYDDKRRDFNILYSYHSSYKTELETVHLKLREAEARLALLATEKKEDSGAANEIERNGDLTHSGGYEAGRSREARRLPSSLESSDKGLDAQKDSSPSTAAPGFALHFPYERKVSWLTRRMEEVENEKTRLVQVIDTQRRVIDRVWELMACAPSLELALREAQRSQRVCGGCGACHDRGQE